jgi:hypothetical protein
MAMRAGPPTIVERPDGTTMRAPTQAPAVDNGPAARARSG